MNFFVGILHNNSIIVPALAWLAAQVLKVLNVVIKEKRLDYSRFIGSGGMPSSHSSFMVALATVVGKNKGWDSIEFGIAVAVALIVMYDAAGVRRAAGKQAEVLNRIVNSIKDNLHFDEKLKELIGHSPLEVVMGAILGIVLGLLLG